MSQKPRSAALLVEGVASTADGIPVELSRTYVRGDRTRYYIERVVVRRSACRRPGINAGRDPALGKQPLADRTADHGGGTGCFKGKLARGGTSRAVGVVAIALMLAACAAPSCHERLLQPATQAPQQSPTATTAPEPTSASRRAAEPRRRETEAPGRPRPRQLRARATSSRHRRSALVLLSRHRRGSGCTDPGRAGRRRGFGRRPPGLVHDLRGSDL